MQKRLATFHREPLNRDIADRERILVAKLDHRPVETVLSALRADVREDAVHLLFGLAHRVARKYLAEAPARAPVCAFGIGVALHPRAVQRVEAADIVEAGDVVHVRVRQDNRVDTVDSVFNAGETHLRRSVYEKADVAGTDVRAASAALVARVRRGADLASAPDLRNADRCTSS